MMKRMIATFALVLSLVPFLFVAPAFAQGEPLVITKDAKPPASFVSGITGCIESGNCSLCDVLKFFGTIAQWILATVGALALFFFVLGGFDLLTSQGKQENVEKGKKKITGALIGLLVVLGAYTLINVVLGLTLGNPTDTNIQLNTIKGKTKTSWQNIECAP